MVDTNWEDLQQLASRNYNLDLQGALRKATGLRLDTYGIVRRLYGKQNEPNEVFTQLQQILSNRALLLDGTSGCFCSTPDAAALDIVGDIDIRIEYVDAFNNAIGTGMLAKYGAAGQRSYKLTTVTFLNAFSFGWSADGTTELSLSTPNTPGTQLGALRVTLDVDNGAAGRTVRVYSAATLAGPFVEIGSGAISTPATSIFASTAALVLGSTVSAGNSNNFRGRITRMELRAGIDGTVVANPDFRALAPGTTSFADGTGKTWTLQGTAQVV